MSCAVPKLLSYYSNKVNIYDSDCFIPLPAYRTCPPPSCILLAPQLVYPPAGPYIPPAVCPMPQPTNYPGAYCGKPIVPYNPPCGNNSVNYGTTIPCGPCGTPSQTTGCAPCGSAPTPCGSYSSGAASGCTSCK